MTSWALVDKAVKEPCPSCSREMSVFGRRALCASCGASYLREKPRRSSRLVVELTDTDVARMLAHARRCDHRDFAILGFLASGFRRSEVVGGDDNMVVLPGVHVEDVFLDQQGVRVIGKGQSPAIREGLDPKRVLQPVARVFLEAALSRGFETGPVFEDVNTHQVGDLVKEYARLASVAEWEEVRPHQLRHWFSNAVRKRGVAQTPQGQLEWTDMLRHSRKSAGSVTIAFYSGATTSYERRLEICLTTFAPVLEQLQSPTFIASLPAPFPLPAPQQIDIPTVRVHPNSIISEKKPKAERETVPEAPIHSITSRTLPDNVRDSKPVAAPSEPAPSLPARSEPVETVEIVNPDVTSSVDPPAKKAVDEPPASEPVADPFSEEENPETESVEQEQPLTKSPHVAAPENVLFTGYDASGERDQVKTSDKIVYYTKDSLDTVEEPVESEPEPSRLPSLVDIYLAWQRIRHDQRDQVERQKLWKKVHCAVSGCKRRIVAHDETRWVCEEHCLTLHDPPQGWLPDV